MLTLRLVKQSFAVGHGSSSVTNAAQAAASAAASALSTAMVHGGTTGSWQFETAQQSTAAATATAWAAPRARSYLQQQQQYRGPEQAGEHEGSRQRREGKIKIRSEGCFARLVVDSK